uniref:RNA helicase n=1 Tax=Panagrolaimus davidi TaxID=227884 RepID=A0A914Q7Q8_9BILA
MLCFRVIITKFSLIYYLQMFKKIKNLFRRGKSDTSNGKNDSKTESERTDTSSSNNGIIPNDLSLSSNDSTQTSHLTSHESSSNIDLNQEHNHISQKCQDNLIPTIQIPSSCTFTLPSTAVPELSSLKSNSNQDNTENVLPQFNVEPSLISDHETTPTLSSSIYSSSSSISDESLVTQSEEAVEKLFTVSHVVANIPGVKIYNITETLPPVNTYHIVPSASTSASTAKPDVLKMSNESEWLSLGGNSCVPLKANVKTGYSNKVKQQAEKPNTWATRVNSANQHNAKASMNQFQNRNQNLNKFTTVTQSQANNQKKKKSRNKNKKPQPISKIFEENNKKKRSRNNGGFVEWIDEPEGNEDDAFEMFEITLSIYNYYKSYGLIRENGMIFDPKNSNNEPIVSEFSYSTNISDSASDNDEENEGNEQKLRDKFHVKDKDFVFPKIYQDLLFVARITRKLSYNLLNQSPFDEEILNNLEMGFSDVYGAGQKLKVFNYLQLIQEILETDDCVAQGATVTIEDAQSKKLRRLFIQSKQTQIQVSDGKRINNVMVIKIPFQSNPNAENEALNGVVEKVTLMRQIYLIRDIDVAYGVEDAKYYKVRVAMTFPSENQGPTILIALLDEIVLKQLSELKGYTFSIFLVPNIEAANAILKSVDKIMKSLELTEKVFPTTAVYQRDIHTYKQLMSRDLDSLFYNSQKSFNQKQKEAIYAMTRPVNTTFLLFGPPGTGKSYIIAETVRQLLDPENQKTSTDRTILICTPSNMAADAIAEAIVDRKFLNVGEMFRLISICREAFTRNEKLDLCTKRTMVYDIDNELVCPVYDIPYAEVIRNYKVIICTLGSIPRLRNFVEPGHFSHIFVDEAGQAPEMDVWLAVGYLATKKTRIILAGDPKQLGPTTTVEVLYNKHYGFKTSLLARLMEQDTFMNDPRYLIQLTDNHRSHEGIVKISSELFYENSLVATKPAGHDSLCCLPFLQKLDFPILFHSVISGKEETSETQSRRNMAEVEVIVRYVTLCLKYVKSRDIGVVSPYKYQAESIRKRLNNKEITVETVEKFQGSERRVIIITTVRTSGNLGFMADDLRFNTSITRAKHLLIVVGNKSVFRTQLSWKRFMDYCAQNDSMVDGFNEDEKIANSLAHLL